MARVLVVDDEFSIRSTLEEFLSTDGHDVDIAGDADEALKSLEANEYDVVVSDVVLPGINGVDLLKKIRALASHVQVIMMTGEPTVETAAEAVRAGATDYLVKPVSKAAVLRSVRNAAKVKAVDDERRRLATLEWQYKQELERLVEERTNDLLDTNRDLSAALEGLKHAQEHMIQQERLRALAQMVSGIAHDFNNVLMPILGFSDLLRNNPQTLDDREETYRLLDIIKDAAEDGRSIVRRLREFYKPDAKLEVQSVDLNKLVKKIVRLMEPIWKVQAEAEGKQVELTCSVTDLPQVEINESQIREVMTNLLRIIDMRSALLREALQELPTRQP